MLNYPQYGQAVRQLLGPVKCSIVLGVFFLAIWCNANAFKQP